MDDEAADTEVATRRGGARRASERPAEARPAHRLAPLSATTEGAARLLELLLVADYLQCEHLKQLGERLVVEWEVVQVGDPRPRVLLVSPAYPACPLLSI